MTHTKNLSSSAPAMEPSLGDSNRATPPLAGVAKPNGMNFGDLGRFPSVRRRAVVALVSLLGAWSTQAATISITHYEKYRDVANLRSAGFGFFDVTHQQSQSNSMRVRLKLTAAERLMIVDVPTVMVGGSFVSLVKTNSDGYSYGSNTAFSYLNPAISGNFSNRRIARSVSVEVGQLSSSVSLALLQSSVTNTVPGSVLRSSLPMTIIAEDDSVTGGGARSLPTITPASPSHKMIVRTPQIRAKFLYKGSETIHVGANGVHAMQTDYKDGAWTAVVGLNPGSNIVYAEGDGGVLPAGVRVIYDAIGGEYGAALVDSADGIAGSISLTIATKENSSGNLYTSQFTAKVIVDGKAFRFHGTNPLGQTISGNSVQSTLATLNLTEADEDSLSGTFTYGGETFTVRGGRNVNSAKFRPAPAAGILTLRMAPTQRERSIAGDSIARVVVRTDGKARMVGIMANGAPFSAGGILVGETVLPFSAQFGSRKQRGLVGGELNITAPVSPATFVASGQSTVTWPGEEEAAAATIEGGSFFSPTRKVPSNAFGLSNADAPEFYLEQLGAVPLAVVSPSRVAPVDALSTLKISPVNEKGFFSGSIRESGSGLTRKFLGIALQQGDEVRGAGFSITPTGSQPFSIQLAAVVVGPESL